MNFENMLLHEIKFDLDFSIRYHKHKHINIKLTNYKIEYRKTKYFNNRKYISDCVFIVFVYSGIYKNVQLNKMQ